MRIYKYILEVTDEPILELPKGARILSVQNQREEICVWAMVDTTKRNELRHFLVIGTGHNIIDEIADPKRFAFIGTVQMEGGALVWHIFETLK